MRVLPYSILSLLIATPVLAADAIVYDDTAPVAIAAAPVLDWTGFYVGGQLGGAFGTDDGVFSLSPFTPALGIAFAPGFSGDFEDSIIGGVHAGYDYQFGSFVVGGLIDISATDLSDTQSGFSTTPARYTITRELDYLATLRARAGFALANRFLIYGTGGLAYGEVDFSYEQPGSTAVTTTSGGQDDDFGYTVGGGVEALVTPRVSVGLEYLYVDLGGNDFEATLTSAPGDPFSPVAGASTSGTGSDEDFDFHVVQLKASFRF